MAKILLIDDDAEFRSHLARILEHDGHSVAIAEDGGEGIRVLEREPVDLVITDVVMPRVDGFELLTRLRRMDAPPGVIVVSGGGRGSSDLYLDLARKLGADAALPKPIVLNEMRAHISRLLNRA